MFERLWVQIPAPYTGWTFFCKNCIVCLKSMKINEKEAGVGPFKKNDGDVGLSIFSHLDWHFFIEINKNIISLA